MSEREPNQTRRRNAPSARRARWLKPLWWLALLLFVGSGVWLGYYAVSAAENGQAISSIGDTVTQLRASSDLSTPEPGKTPAPEQQPVAAEKSDPENDPLLAYYRELAAKNPDMIGWVSIADTIVDYPVMYTPGEPKQYLHRNFENHNSLAGTPFLDARCDPEHPTQNKIIYAHNMRSGQMFAQLISYLEPDFLAAHPSVAFDTLNQRGDYTVFAVLQINLAGMDDPSMQCYRVFDTAQQEDVDALNDYIAKYAAVCVGEAQRNDRILTLSTCQHLGSIDRLVVLARQAAPEDGLTKGTGNINK